MQYVRPRFVFLSGFFAAMLPNLAWGQINSVFNHDVAVVDLSVTTNWSQPFEPPGIGVRGTVFSNDRNFVLSRDWGVESLRFIGRPGGIELGGHELQTNLDYSNTVGSDPAFEISNGRFTGTSEFQGNWKNVDFTGDFGDSQNGILGLHGLMKTFLIPGLGAGALADLILTDQTTLTANQTNIAGSRLALLDNSHFETDVGNIGRLIVRDGSSFNLGFGRVENTFVEGQNSFATMANTGNFSNDFFRTLSAQNQGSIEINTANDRSAIVTGIIRVEGPGSSVKIQGADKSIVRVLGSDLLDPDSHTTVGAASRVSNGGRLEIGGILQLMMAGFRTVDRFEIDHATVIADVQLLDGELRLIDGILEGDISVESRSIISGSGRISGSVTGPFGESSEITVRPDGLLTIEGEYSLLLSPIEFDMRQSNDFDVLRIEGSMFAFPQLRVRFDDAFRGSVGDQMNFLEVLEEFSDLSEIITGNIQLSNLPSGYQVMTVISPNALGIKITAVPEVSACQIIAGIITIVAIWRIYTGNLTG